MIPATDDQPISEEEAFSPDGVELTLIYWFLKLTPAQRLARLQDYVDSALGAPADYPKLQQDFCCSLRRQLEADAAAAPTDS